MAQTDKTSSRRTSRDYELTKLLTGDADAESLFLLRRLSFAGRRPQGIDFFTVEVLTWRGLTTYYVLFFIHLESRRMSLAGITRPRPSMDAADGTQRDQ